MIMTSSSVTGVVARQTSRGFNCSSLGDSKIPGNEAIPLLLSVWGDQMNLDCRNDNENRRKTMSRMAIIALGFALLGTTACENLSGWGNGTTSEGRSTTSGGAALGTRGGNGPATGTPRTTNSGTTKSDRSSPGDLTRQGTIPGEDMLN
jgi:hypothetical protein